MATKDISVVISKFEKELLEDWIRLQLASSTKRSDLLSDSELRSSSETFLNALRAALESDSSNIHAAPFAEVLENLSEVSRRRGRLGFSPSETASFIFSFKQPLCSALQKEYADDPRKVVELVWEANVLLDKLGLYTTEIYQQGREEVIRRQQEEMLELSTPVVQIWEGVVALPLIGTLDSARTSVVMETLLQSIVETRSQIAIIDITGVPTVDTLVAQHLLKTVAAARLMGADCIISGIRPQIAQTMVHLQIDLSAVTTKASMAEALKLAIARSGFTIARNAKKVAVAAE